MPMSAEEVADIKADVRVVKDAISEMSNISKENTKAQINLTAQISSLVTEMKVRDVRVDTLIDNTEEMKTNQKDFEKFARPILVKAKASQEFKTKVTDSMGTSTGKLLIAAIFTGLLYLAAQSLSINLGGK